ncbi:MAG: hypothetical protein FWF50_05465 [Defluviitaleaceae bacterium]|nr:hypothetical protein [Defluviitaleaceae bacterium]
MRPKIFVLHIRQIIKLGIAVVIGLILIFTLLYMFLGRGGETMPAVYNIEGYEHKQAGSFSPGSFTAYVPLNYQNAYVVVTVSENEITNIELAPLTENQVIFYPLLEITLENISEYILENQTLTFENDIYAQTTSRVLINAIARAITEAMNTSATYLQEVPEL